MEKIQQEHGLQEAAEKLIRNCDGRKCSECYFFHRNRCGFWNSPLNWGVICSQENEKQAVVTEDNVNHPSHYMMPGGGEVIDFIDAACGDGAEFYYLGNILKYVCRYRDKGGAESLKKAKWYLEKLIALQETKEELEDEN